MEQIDGGHYRTFSGQIDGKITASAFTLAEAKNTGKKNATTADEQAEAEILAQYKKKKKLKYKDSVDDIDQKTYVSPMLAEKHKDYEDSIDFYNGDWLAQIKFNGMRCVARLDGLFTRKGEPIPSAPHIHEDLKVYFARNPHAFLDGELFNYELREQLNEFMKIVRKTVRITEEEFAKSKAMVKYYVYDMGGLVNDYSLDTFGVPFDGFDVSEECYTDRKFYIDNVLPSYTRYVAKVQDFQFTNEAELWALYNSFLDDKQEGIILRNKKSKYQYKRTKDLIKLKPEDDAEGVIKAIHLGTGNWGHVAKTVTIEWEGKTFDATLKCTMEEAAKFLADSDFWMERTVTFHYHGLTGLGIPNYAKLDVNNCLKS